MASDRAAQRALAAPHSGGARGGRPQPAPPAPGAPHPPACTRCASARRPPRAPAAAATAELRARPRPPRSAHARRRAAPRSRGAAAGPAGQRSYAEGLHTSVRAPGGRAGGAGGASTVRRGRRGTRRIGAPCAGPSRLRARRRPPLRRGNVARRRPPLPPAHCPPCRTSRRSCGTDAADALDGGPAKDCGQPIREGPCHGAVWRWGFDAASGRCTRFSWGGCKPNGNNFKTRRGCTSFCRRVAPRPALLLRLLRGQPAPSPVASPPTACARPRSCRSHPPCRPRARSGLITPGQASSDALPAACSEPVELGRCRAYLPRWAFDPADGACKRFIYSALARWARCPVLLPWAAGLLGCCCPALPWAAGLLGCCCPALPCAAACCCRWRSEAPLVACWLPGRAAAAAALPLTSVLSPSPSTNHHPLQPAAAPTTTTSSRKPRARPSACALGAPAAPAAAPGPAAPRAGCGSAACRFRRPTDTAAPARPPPQAARAVQAASGAWALRSLPAFLLF